MLNNLLDLLLFSIIKDSLINVLTWYLRKMARVTVEDCTKVIPNRFELVVLSSRRARDISSGSEIKVERDNDKDAVIALREIAESKLSKEYLLEEVVSSYQNNVRYVAEEVDGEAKASYEEEAGAKADAQAAEGAPAEAEDKGMFAEDNIAIED